jgi:hypothetical protein
MSKLSKEELARYQGANWILDKIKAVGIEEAEKELINRGARDMPLAVKESDLHKFEQSEKSNTIKTMLLFSIYCMYDEFDLSVEQINKFITRFNSRAESLIRDYVSWKDIQQTMAEETGIFVPLPESFDME